MELTANISEQSYAIAVPCYEGKLTVETAMSLLGLSMKLSEHNIGHSFLIVKGGALIHNVRNDLVHRFLHQTNCSTLVFVDADVGFDWEAFERLAVFSCMYPIIAGCYPSRTEECMFFLHGHDGKLNEHGLIKVTGTGMGFTAIQRNVFDKIQVPEYNHKQYGKVKAFFQMDLQPNDAGLDGLESTGEDIWFYKNAAKFGIPTYVDPGINLTHTGMKTWDGKLGECIATILKQ